VAREKKVEIKALEIMPDQVHGFIAFGLSQPLHELIKTFKSKSSRILKNKYPSLKNRRPLFWPRAYFCCTLGDISEATGKQYLKKQKKV